MHNFIPALFVLLILVGCTKQTPSTTITPEPSIEPTGTYSPSNTPTITFTATKTIIPIATKTPTPEPIFVTIGSPFPIYWGTPLIWANDSFNGPFDASRMDMHHGHMDVAVPMEYSHYWGFDLEDHDGDVVAPVGGEITKYEYGLKLVFPENTYPAGILEALTFSGIENPTLVKISKIEIDLGHVKDAKVGPANKGEVIAEIKPQDFNWEAEIFVSGVAFQVSIWYGEVEYLMSPTLFELDMDWECYPNSPFDCEPEPHDYAP